METIDLPQVQQAYQQQLGTLSRQLPTGSEPTPEMRHAVVNAALQNLINQATISQELRQLGIMVPDEAVRRIVFAMPAFRGASGQFDRATFEAVLRNNGLNEQRFLELVRDNLAQQQLVDAIAAGAVVYRGSHQVRPMGWIGEPAPDNRRQQARGRGIAVRVRFSLD